jgi:NAD(P)-dependent dehydrogenase (short-subunit alcohol dehydrogenase family)
MDARKEREWAVILGVSQGTGAAIARAVAREAGLNVFGAHRGRHVEAAAGVERDVRAAGGDVSMWVADAGNAEAARSGAEALARIAGRGRVRLFVHSIANASVGTLASGATDQLSARQIGKTFESMAHSFVYWSQELVARGLLAPGARLIGLTNPIVDSLIPRLSLVAATKAALAVYVRELARELGPAGYRVNLINFGLVDSRAASVAFDGDAWERAKARASAVTPAGRLCTVEEVARLVSILVGPGGEWFNGATIDFTGGMTQGLLGVALHAGEGMAP